MTAATTAILYAPGINCHEETAAAIEAAGGKSTLVLLSDLLEGRARLGEFQAAVIPGGFSYGDHQGAGRIFGTVLVARLCDQLKEFLDAGKPMLGVCNGFQVLTDAGILPGRSPGTRRMALLENESARFEDRKIRVVVTDGGSIWTAGLAGRVLAMPTAHGEGRPIFPSIDTGHLNVIFRYVDASGQPTNQYPENPNGAPCAIAGVADSTGLVLGLMPHPERASLPAHYSQDGLHLFRNLLRHL